MPSKQKTLHSAPAIWLGRIVCATVCVPCIAFSAGSATGQTVSRTLGDQVAKMRLIAAPGPTNGRYAAGVEITMAPGSHTYWKQPGEAGVPPVFAFNGSVNVAKAEVLFPAPSRIGEEGLQAFGYLDHVVFPVEVTPADPAKPAELKAVVDYAVCNKICIPAHGTATLTLTPGGSSTDAEAVRIAVARVPVPLAHVDETKLTITPEKGAAKQSWTIEWTGTPAVNDVFAEAPEGFFFDTKKNGTDRFTLTAVQAVSAQATTQVPVSLTFVGKTGAFVAKETVSVAGSTN